MNILLLSMPDSFEHTPTVSIRMPNGALSSLAGNIDPRHQVAVADLILVQKTVRATIEDLVEKIQPDLVGLSVMTFQRKTAKKIIDLLRCLRPSVRIVVGGYDPSMAPEAYDGTTAVVRTDHLTAEEIEFLRWRAERWMKLRHLPSVFFHSPLFVLRHGAKMLAHTLRGMTLETLLGFEDERVAFERYRTIRQAERASV